jgi:hypothetical protein
LSCDRESGDERAYHRAGCAHRRRGGVRRGGGVEPRVGRLQGRLPRSGRLGGTGVAARVRRRLGTAPPDRFQPGPERPPTAGGLPRQQRGFHLHAAHVQRGRRQHGPLERALPPLPSLRFPRALVGWRRGRLAARLRRIGAVLRVQRPDDRRRGGRGGPGLPAALAPTDGTHPARPARRDAGARLRAAGLALVALGHGADHGAVRRGAAAARSTTTRTARCTSRPRPS